MARIRIWGALDRAGRRTTVKLARASAAVNERRRPLTTGRSVDRAPSIRLYAPAGPRLISAPTRRGRVPRLFSRGAGNSRRARARAARYYNSDDWRRERRDTVRPRCARVTRSPSRENGSAASNVTRGRPPRKPQFRAFPRPATSFSRPLGEDEAERRKAGAKTRSSIARPLAPKSRVSSTRVSRFETLSGASRISSYNCEARSGRTIASIVSERSERKFGRALIAPTTVYRGRTAIVMRLYARTHARPSRMPSASSSVVKTRRSRGIDVTNRG